MMTTMMMRMLAVLSLAAQIAVGDAARQTEETIAWRANRQKELQSERGWLAVSGLPWLKEGGTSVGSGEENAVRLGDGPKVWGKFIRTGTRIAMEPFGGTRREITTSEEPFQIGRSWIQLIRRRDLLGLRIWDPMNARKLGFKGLDWFEAKPEYRVRARFIPTTPTPSIAISNVLGQVNDFKSPGRVRFTLGGKDYELTPVYETEAQDELFYIFKDATAAKSTYGAGRFVYSTLPDQDGNLILDFNRAYSPPCAFTDFATCPLPPPMNRLEVAIEAGEKDPHKAR